jgi:hypothetical protein
MTCVSYMQELTRSNPSTRGRETQIRRLADDSFNDDATTAQE